VQCSTQQYHQPGEGKLPPTTGTKVCIHVNNASDKHNELEVHSSLLCCLPHTRMIFAYCHVIYYVYTDSYNAAYPTSGKEKADSAKSREGTVIISIAIKALEITASLPRQTVQNTLPKCTNMTIQSYWYCFPSKNSTIYLCSL